MTGRISGADSGEFSSTGHNDLKILGGIGNDIAFIIHHIGTEKRDIFAVGGDVKGVLGQDQLCSLSGGDPLIGGNLFSVLEATTLISPGT